MARMKFKARMLRVELQQKEGQNVTVKEVAEAVGMDRYRLSRIEMGNIKEIKTEELMSLCAFYAKRLGRAIGVSDILEYDPNNRRAVELAGLAA